MIPQGLIRLINSDDFNVVTHPVGRQVDTTAVATGLHDLFNHLFAVDFKFDFCPVDIASTRRSVVIFFGSHLNNLIIGGSAAGLLQSQ